MQAVIIAGGESSRFWPLNKDHKSLFCLLGKPLLYWTIKGLAENGVQEIVVVCGKDSQIPSQIGNGSDLGITIFYVYQEKPLGTGNALWQAKDLIKGPFFFIWPNKVNSKEIVAAMRLKIDQTGSDCVMVATENSSPGSGMIRMQGNIVEEIVEKPLSWEGPNIRVSGAFFFREDFFSYYAGLSRHHEFDFIDALNRYVKDKQASVLMFSEKVPTLKYPWHAFSLLGILLESPYFQPTIAPSAVIAPNVVIEGKVYVGENVVIKSGTLIEGPCFIGDNCRIGYSNVIRGPVNFEPEVKTGSFCEISSSIIQRGTHMHSGYMGNCVVGKDCRFGAGFITANRRIDRNTISVKVKEERVDSGLTRFGTVVGDKTRFGIHTGTMPGVLVGAECNIFPGTLVFENLLDNTTFSTKLSNSSKR